MQVKFFSPITRTGLRDREQSRIDRRIAKEQRHIERLKAHINAMSTELAEREGVKAALSDSRATLAIDVSVSDLLEIDFKQAAE